jgi:FMN phosphatase YigB (HAD superfamily)
MDIDALSFDLDDTLWAFAPAQARAEATLHAWLLARVPATVALLTDVGALARYRQMAAAAHPGWSTRADLVRRESIRVILDAAGGDPSLAGAAYEVFWAARQCVELYEDVLPSLRWLSRYYPLYAVTNGNSDLAATGVGEFFRGAVTAYRIGAAKPEARIFHAAAEALGVAPHRCAPDRPWTCGRCACGAPGAAVDNAMRCPPQHPSPTCPQPPTTKTQIRRERQHPRW